MGLTGMSCTKLGATRVAADVVMVHELVEAVQDDFMYWHTTGKSDYNNYAQVAQQYSVEAFTPVGLDDATSVYSVTFNNGTHKYININ
jgi:hypothetical protein